MFHPKPAFWLALVSTATCAAAMAQQAPPPGASPASTPAPYKSALEGYQPFAEEKLAPWNESNDTVGKIGGWRAYAREASEGAGKPVPPRIPPVPPATSGGHKH
jgi:hypothetical protein